MSIVPALQCRTLDSWYPSKIDSDTDPDKSYTVHVNPWANRSEQHVCECKSYHYRGYCKHQKIAHEQHCGWNEIEGPEEPLKEMICPRCSGPTMHAMYEVENGS